MIRVRLRIEGRVQGVGFRERTRAAADILNVKGWVKNLPDGSVEAEIEGEDDAVERMVAWCQHGPVTASVRRVSVLLRDTELKDYPRFSITL